MRFPLALLECLEEHFASSGEPEATPVSGGCIHAAHRLVVDGQTLFLKSGSPDMLEVFKGEAEGLGALLGAGAFKVPEVIDCGGDAEGSWLLMEWLDLGGRLDMEKAGRSLALQHKAQADQHGFGRDNHIGSTPQINTRESDWFTFYGRHRLGEMARMGVKKGLSFRRIDQLIERLPSFFGGREVAPCLLHGDLWSGNISALSDGGVAVYDPAVHYGDRECDLAMTELFGGFSSAFYDAYHESFPLDEGYAIRRELYQLYHLMNHALLFGGSYGSQSQRVIDHLLSQA